MQIVFDESTLSQADNRSRSITGVLFLDFEGFCFPSEGWTDFVVVMARWWMEAVGRIERGDAEQVELTFMDGPYWVELVRVGNDTVSVKCVEDRDHRNILHQECARLMTLSDAVRRLVVGVGLACARARFESDDVEALRKYLPN